MAYDAVNAAKARGSDVLVLDTAGRLQTKVNLMNELAKVHRVVQRELGRDLDEILLVVDATTGQNALSQAKMFQEAVPLSGIALTKLDGTAKGGIVLALANELNLAVKLVEWESNMKISRILMQAPLQRHFWSVKRKCLTRLQRVHILVCAKY